MSKFITKKFLLVYFICILEIIAIFFLKNNEFLIKIFILINALLIFVIGIFKLFNCKK